MREGGGPGFIRHPALDFALNPARWGAPFEWRNHVQSEYS